jgi:hypothetical protein
MIRFSIVAHADLEEVPKARAQLETPGVNPGAELPSLYALNARDSEARRCSCLRPAFLSTQMFLFAAHAVDPHGLV